MNTLCCILIQMIGYELPDETASKSRRRILITSFGPFRDHDVNPSTSVLRKVEQLFNEQALNHDINYIFDFPVCYAEVDSHLPELVEKYKPTTLIHLGLGGQNEVICIEEGAFCRGYAKPDVRGKVPLNNRCKDQCSENICLHPNAEWMSLARTAGARKDLPMKFEFSDCAGRYLCEYIYHKSLSLSNGRSLFIHIPLSMSVNGLEIELDALIELCARSLVMFLLDLLE